MAFLIHIFPLILLFQWSDGSNFLISHYSILKTQDLEMPIFSKGIFFQFFFSKWHFIWKIEGKSLKFFTKIAFSINCL